MDTKRIAEIRKFIQDERELYAQFVKEKNAEALHLCRARVFFFTMQCIMELLDIAEQQRLLTCGHPAACLKFYTKKGQEVCLRCEFEKKGKKHVRKTNRIH